MPSEDVRTRACGRSRLAVAALVAGGLLGPPNVVQSARADDGLHQRQEETADRLEGARRNYDAASGALLRAFGALRQARTQLVDARQALGTRRADLALARAAHRQAQDDLVEANRRLDDARSRLRSGRERSVELQNEWKQQVIAEYQTGGVALGALSAMLDSADPAELMEHVGGLDAVNASYDATLARARASVTLMDVFEQELSAARDEVQVSVEETQRRLLDITRAEAAAQEARDRVVILVARRREAATEAAAVRARDAAQIRRLQAEQARIQRMLRKRAAAAEAAARKKAENRNPAPGRWAWPTPGWISTPFGWRTHPIYGYRSFHNGIDIAAACGTPVRAPLAGTVLSTYFQSAYGNRVLIDHGAPDGVGTATEYNHLQRWVVTPRERVSRGQIVGYVGNTGWSTGCHLHFTTYRSGRPVDPLSLLR